MKTFKLAVFSLAMVLVVFTSCTNNESVIEDQQTTEESESITNSLLQLRTQFDDSGNVTQTDNPAGNIVLDFCFDFVYPLELSYNNGTTVTVADLDGLIDIMFSYTENLYINGISFPFNVETYNDDTNAIEIETINNEDEFISLLENCDFDVVEPCNCFEVYDPVCVEITDPNGGTFTVTYPNACYAECDGFTENDFAENCEDDYNPSGNECFTLNFPLSIITDDGTTIVINSEDELGNALYDVYYFDFAYPFTVTLDNEDVVTISSPEDIEAILADCFGDIGGNDCTECENSPIEPVCIQYTSPNGETTITVFQNICYAICEGFTENNIVDCDDDDDNPDDCVACSNTVSDPVCIQYIDASGEIIVIVFENMCYAECEGYSANDIVNCNDDDDDDDDDVNPTNCSEEDITSFLLECEWFAISSINPNNNPGVFSFNADGTISVFIEGNTLVGTWQLASNSQSDEIFMFISLPEPYATVSNLDWTVVSCIENYILLESNNEFLSFERECE